MISILRRALLILTLSLICSTSIADDIQPAYLAIQESAENHFNILWKRPIKNDKPLELVLTLPLVCEADTEKRIWASNGYAIESWSTICDGGLSGQSIKVDGLASSLSDALVRVELANGQVSIERLTPQRTGFMLESKPETSGVVVSYLKLGIEHILMGWDHLLFVLCIMMLVGRSRKLFWAITAFTVAHSVTLIAVTMGYIQFNTRVVEILIALSIVLLAYEIVRNKNGVSGLSTKYPWMVILIFGLMHGVGFAGALNNIGLPPNDIPLALLFFNLGVEAGQLIFVLVVLSLLLVVNRLMPSRTDWTTGAAYCIGIGASFWFFERLVLLL